MPTYSLPGEVLHEYLSRSLVRSRPSEQFGFIITSAKRKLDAMTQFLHLTSGRHQRAIGQYNSYRFVAFSNITFVATRQHDQQRCRLFDRRLMQPTMPVEIIPSQRHTNNFGSM